MLGSLNTSNAVVAFEKMEEKVMAMEAEADSVAALVRIAISLRQLCFALCFRRCVHCRGFSQGAVLAGAPARHWARVQRQVATGPHA